MGPDDSEACRRRPIMGGDRVRHFMGATGRAISIEGLLVVVQWDGCGSELIPAAVIDRIADEEEA